MKSLKTVLLSTAVLAGFGLFLGGKDAFADEQYTVQSGDTLSTIATNFYGYSSDDTINAIVEANEIADKNLIFVGEALIIPTDGTATYTESASTTAAASVQQPSEAAASQSSNTQSAASTQSSSSYSSSASGSEASAKEWIANKESGGSYT
ncbi:MAG: LysM domain-containing protein, partial [Enterococcus casseliflavus]|nr:LysM domain-containing protein [Enterococcus casseliflavus]